MKNNMKTISISIIAMIVALAGCGSEKEEPYNAEKEMTDQYIEILNKRAKEEAENAALKALNEESARKAKQLDEGERILDARATNNDRIKLLLGLRNELTNSVEDLITVISNSGLPDTMERLKDPKLQEGIDKAKEFEEEIKKISSDNYKLKLEWSSAKSYMPDDVRFSDPEFFKCSSLTSWKIENH